MNIIITGASRGIGYHTALHLAKHKNHRIAVIARNNEALNQLVNECKKQNFSHVIPVAFDLGVKNFQPLVKAIDEVFNLSGGNKIDVIINNAGFLVNKPFLELSDEDWQTMFEINVFAPARLIRLLHPYLNKTEGSHIVNIGSMGGIQGTAKFPGLSGYGASKGAINILSETLAEEFRGDKVRVNSINPGAVQTDMLAQAFPGFHADVTPDAMGAYIAGFALDTPILNGRLIQASLRS